MDRARKIAKRLHDRWGGTTEEECEFPPKPPRMRWATYNRLEEQYDEMEIDGLLASWPGSPALSDASNARPEGKVRARIVGISR